MNIQEAIETVELANKVEILWKEREIVTAVLYEEYCKRNNLSVPKHINDLLKTAYDNFTSNMQEEENITEQKEKTVNNKRVFSPKDF